MPATDFDFLPGRWNVHNRKLVNTLDPACDEWEEFEATSTAFSMLDGGGNHDHFHAPDYEGFSLRLYDPSRDVWRIWWSSTARPGGSTRRSRAGSPPMARPLRGRRRPRRRAAADALRVVRDHRRGGPLGAVLLLLRRG